MNGTNGNGSVIQPQQQFTLQQLLAQSPYVRDEFGNFIALPVRPVAVPSGLEEEFLLTQTPVLSQPVPIVPTTCAPTDLACNCALFANALGAEQRAVIGNTCLAVKRFPEGTQRGAAIFGFNGLNASGQALNLALFHSEDTPLNFANSLISQ